MLDGGYTIYLEGTWEAIGRQGLLGSALGVDSQGTALVDPGCAPVCVRRGEEVVDEEIVTLPVYLSGSLALAAAAVVFESTWSWNLI